MRETLRFLRAFRLDCEGLIGQCVMSVTDSGAVLGTQTYFMMGVFAFETMLQLHACTGR